MAEGVPLLLLDPNGLLKKIKLAERWSVHAFQSIDEATAGLSFLEPQVVLTTLSADGLALSRTVAARDPSRPVVMGALEPALADVMRAMRVGVRDVVDVGSKKKATTDINRALDVALGWRKTLQKGVAAELERLRGASADLQRQVAVLQARLGEQQQQLDAEEGVLAQTQRELEVQRELALAAVRAKSRFLANMSHELHTPLNAIIGYAELLREDLGAQQRDQAEHIIASARSLLGLLQDVMNLSRLEAGQVHPVFEPVGVSALLETAVEGVQGSARGGGVTVTVGDCAVDEVVTDTQRLAEALGQVIDNAVKFSPGGKVDISVRREVQGPDSWAVFSIADTGVGIAPGALARIFDAFTQGDESSERAFAGTGLGLAVSRQIARVLGGRLEGHSEVGKGSVFEIWIPDAAVTAVSEAVGAELTILVIDDDPVLRTLVQRMLVADGHSVVASGSGRDAVELARQHQPALVLLDVTLPGVDGFDVLASLKDDPAVSAIPVVMVSTNDDQEKAVELGACDFLVKPLNRESLRRVISKNAKRERPSGLIVVGHELPSCVVPLARERHDVRAVPAGRLAEALRNRPGAVVLPVDLPIGLLRDALLAVESVAPEVPVLALVGALRDEERRFLANRLSGVVSMYGDPSARLRRYASAR